jgi:hypothetical protein
MSPAQLASVLAEQKAAEQRMLESQNQRLGWPQRPVLGMATGQWHPQFGDPYTAPPEAEGRFPGSDIQLIGDVITGRFRGRTPTGEVPGVPATGPMPGARGGSYGSKWRDPRFVEQEAARRGIEPGHLQPVAPRSAEVTRLMPEPQVTIRTMSLKEAKAQEAADRALAAKLRPTKKGETDHMSEAQFQAWASRQPSAKDSAQTSFNASEAQHFKDAAAGKFDGLTPREFNKRMMNERINKPTARDFNPENPFGRQGKTIGEMAKEKGPSTEQMRAALDAVKNPAETKVWQDWATKAGLDSGRVMGVVRQLQNEWTKAGRGKIPDDKVKYYLQLLHQRGEL